MTGHLRSRERRPASERCLRSKSIRIARYALHAPVLPRVSDTVPFAERVRVILMGIHRKVMGGDPADVSPLMSGKSRGGKPARGHEHLFILPLDEDGDGRIDHLMLRAARPFDASELEALDRLRKVWQTGGRQEVRLVLVSLQERLIGRAVRRFVSATPFVTARHHRKGRGPYGAWIESELRKECDFHGLPEPDHIEPTRCTPFGGHEIRWMEFVRSRKGRRPMQGHGFEIYFPEPVHGPFSLGALCHYGLGLFVPLDR